MDTPLLAFKGDVCAYMIGTKISWPGHEILVPIIYAQTSPLNAYAGVSSRARSMHFGVSLYQHPYYVYTNIEGSGSRLSLHGL